MITRSNELTVPEVAAYSRQQIEGGTIIRYLIRQPGETEWRVVKLFRASADAPTPTPNAITRQALAYQPGRSTPR